MNEFKPKLVNRVRIFRIGIHPSDYCQHYSSSSVGKRELNVYCVSFFKMRVTEDAYASKADVGSEVFSSYEFSRPVLHVGFHSRMLTLFVL